MAESNLTMMVNTEVSVRLVPDEATSAWLESIGWKRPEEENSDEPAAH